MTLSQLGLDFSAPVMYVISNFFENLQATKYNLINGKPFKSIIGIFHRQSHQNIVI